MNYSDIQHRFANKLEGKYGCIKGGNTRYEGRNFYSYSTVFGQWVDISKNVVVIFDGRTSTSSSKHKLGNSYFPNDVHVFPLDFSGGYYGWNNCNLVSEYNFSDKDFKEHHRMQMIDHYVGRIYNQIAAINGGKKKGLENVSFEAWDYIEELCSLYKDTSIAKYLKWTKNKDYKKLMKMLKSGTREVPYLVDQLFGSGTWMQYWDYCARFRKAAEKKEKVLALCKRIGIADPYCDRYWSGVWKARLTADEVRKLTAKERNDIHFASLIRKEEYEKEDERKEKYNKNFRNAYKWIVGFEPQKKSWGGGYESDVHNNCINKDNGVVYECSGEYIYRFYWCDTEVSFDYNSFRKSEDKEQWIVDFYAKCKEVADNRKAILTLGRVKAHIKEKKHSWDEDVYINDDYLRENTTKEEYIICSEFIKKQDKHYEEEEAQERAREIERLRREEEERKEREYMEHVKQEQIDECLGRGLEGHRDLWRLHLQSIGNAELGNNLNEFYHNGNVLLRMNLNKDKVETSKSIRISVEVCKKMWDIVSKWHENPNCFKSMQIDTKGSGKYTISSYKDDILTAGCHKIAYTEMERMYNEIINA